VSICIDVYVYSRTALVQAWINWGADDLARLTSILQACGGLTVDNYILLNNEFTENGSQESNPFNSVIALLEGAFGKRNAVSIFLDKKLTVQGAAASTSVDIHALAKQFQVSLDEDEWSNGDDNFDADF
jgi:hypothetical protein